MDVLTQFLTKTDSRRLKVAVIGDSVLDEYYAVKVNRISPEFPIEVMLSESDKPVSVVPGGAANVCYQMKYWNVETHLVSVLDPDAVELIDHTGIDVHYCVTMKDWKTPRKKRFYDGDFPIDRWDVEIKTARTNTPEWIAGRHELVTNVCKMLVQVQPDLVIMSDYGKGIFASYDIAQAIINYCGVRGIPTIVDPKSLDLRYWQNCTYLKPNADWVKGFCDKYGKEPSESKVRWGDELEFVHDKIKPKSIILTDSGNGMALYNVDLDYSDDCPPQEYGHSQFFTSPELSRRRPIIRSVIGAGDCFCAFLAMATGHHFDLEEAMTLAFNGSSAYIEDKHNSPVTPYVFTKWFDPIQAKKVSIVKLLNIKSQLPNQKWVWTNGCFDIIHPGHLKTFEAARKLGDKVVVGLNTDESIKMLKGESRPILSYEQREQQLAHFQYVDFIVPINERTPESLIRTFRPDEIVKGGDYNKEDIAGWDIVGKDHVHLVPLVEDVSTSKIIERIKNGG